ncbi:MAG: hypothetical protein ABIH23_20770, partial [bacterium]
MKRSTVIAIIVAAVLAVLVINWLWNGSPSGPESAKLKLAIAPYQDMAMLAVVEPLGIDKKYDLDLELVSMAWEDLTPAVSSAGGAVDVAFASLIQFISQEASLNANSNDPIVFFYPAYVFKGGGLVSFNDKVPQITKEDLTDADKLREFLSYKFAAQKTSSYEILLFDLADRAGIAFKDVEIFDMDAGNGLLAAINGSVDVSGAGLTQKNEALRKGGRVVLEMQALGQIDIAG